MSNKKPLSFLLTIRGCVQDCYSDGSGSKYFDPGLVWSILVAPAGPGRVTQFGFGKFLNFPLKSQIFNFFPLSSKKISSGQVKNFPGQRWVSLIFTAGQKYAQVRLGWIRAYL